MVVGGVVVGRGGVTIVVCVRVPGDGCGMVGLGVTVGVPGVGTTPGGETVPLTVGGEGTGMLTAGGGETGAAAVVGTMVVVVPGEAGRVEGVVTGVTGAGINPPNEVPSVGCGVAAVPGMAVLAGSGCHVPGIPADSLPVSTGERVMAGVAAASESGGWVIRGPEHPAARSSSTARPARSMNLIRSILVPPGT